MRLTIGPRRGFICRLKVGNLGPDAMASGHLNRLKQRNSLGPSRDGHNYAVVHCTGYIKNWPPTGTEYGMPPGNVTRPLNLLFRVNIPEAKARLK